MPITLNTTPADHIPEEFTVESLTAGGLTEQEIKALSEGDDPIVSESPAPEGQGDDEAAIAAGIGNPPAEQPPVAQQAPAQDPAMPEIPDTTEAKATLDRVEQQIEALADQYDNGDLTKAEFLAKTRELSDQQAKARVQIEAAEMAMQQATQQQIKHWESRLEAYKATAPELWTEAHIQGWDQHLRMVTSNPAYVDLSRDQQIQLAHRMYASAYEARTGQSLAVPKPKAANGREKLEVRQDERPEPPRTLSGFNSDTSAEVEDTAFAMIDRVISKDPLEAERMFSRMTPEQQERFLNEV